MKRMIGWILTLLAAGQLVLATVGWAAEESIQATEETEASSAEKPVVVEVAAPDAHPVDIQQVTTLQATEVKETESSAAEGPAVVEIAIPDTSPAVGVIGITLSEEPVKYTLGVEDIIGVEVRRHPEFSGTYQINSEGKIQYKFVGDISAVGLTKNELKEKLTKILSSYLVEPSIDVTILEYRSKVFYVIGEVGRPGKYYMMADEIPVREAVVQAGLPLLSASAGRTKLITPDASGKPVTKNIDLTKILYKGDLKGNLLMKPGDVLYIPATFLTKVMRTISPVAGPVATAAGTEASVYRLGTGSLQRERTTR